MVAGRHVKCVLALVQNRTYGCLSSARAECSIFYGYCKTATTFAESFADNTDADPFTRRVHGLCNYKGIFRFFFVCVQRYIFTEYERLPNE